MSFGKSKLLYSVVLSSRIPTLCSLVTVNRRFGGTRIASQCFACSRLPALLSLKTWGWRKHVRAICRYILQKIEMFPFGLYNNYLILIRSGEVVSLFSCFITETTKSILVKFGIGRSHPRFSRPVDVKVTVRRISGKCCRSLMIW